MSTIGKSTNIMWHKCPVEKLDRQQLLQQKGCVIWITGLSGSGLLISFISFFSFSFEKYNILVCGSHQLYERKLRGVILSLMINGYILGNVNHADCIITCLIICVDSH